MEQGTCLSCVFNPVTPASAVTPQMKAAADDDEEDDDFEEVPEKEGYEPHIPDHLRGEYGECPVPAWHGRSKENK